MKRRGETMSSTKKARSVKHQTHVGRRENNLEVEKSGWRAPEHHKNNAQEPTHRRDNEDTKEREGESGETKRRKKEHDQRSSRAETGKKRREGKGKYGKSQTGGAVESFGGPPEDCTRVFPMKGAADALCNPKADVPRGVAGQATHGARLRGNPRDNLAQASKTSGRKVAPKAATQEAVFWKKFLRVSTS